MCVPAGLSAGGAMVRRVLDVETAARRRTSCARAAAFNAVVLLAFAADLSYKCEGYTSPLHWVELAFAGVAGANLLRLAVALARPAPSLPPLRPDQCRLLGLSTASATSLADASYLADDHSFDSPSSASSYFSGSATDDLSLSLSPAREWRAAPAPQGPPPSPRDSPPQTPKDIFIADRSSLADYLRDYEERRLESSPPPACVVWGPLAPPVYQVSAGEEGGAKDEVGAAESALSLAWARLHLDPQRLTQFNFNLRVWVHVTILERLVREMAAVDAAMARAGLGVALGEVAVDRLRALSISPHAPPSLAQILPFLEPYSNQRYVVKRIRTLAAGGALSEYKWDGGGPNWDDTEPTDSELILQLFATYLDLQLPRAAPPLRPFSSRHVSAAPARPPQDLAIHKVAAKPPHYVLVLQGETFEVSRGRNNLLHTLLVLIAGLARKQPSALRRLHLGPAGLNLLWIIGR